MATVILKDGKPALLPNHIEHSLKYDTSGFLIQFQNPRDAFETFRYYKSSDFRPRFKSTQKNGYYSVNKFILLNAQTTDLKSIIEFDFTDYIAKPGNEVIILKLVINSPYTTYLQQEKWKFLVEGDVKGQVKNYLTKDGNAIALPSKSIRIGTYVGTNTYRKKFYDYNFGSIVSSWSSDINKEVFAKIATIITLRQRAILTEIFPKITSQTFIDQAGSDNTTYSTLNRLQKLLFHIKKNWAYFYQNGSTSTHANSLFRVLPDDPNFGAYLQYLRGLDAFYRDASSLPLGWTSKSDDQKYDYLLAHFSSEALTILSYIDRAKLITKYALTRDLSDDNQDILVSLINSIEVTYADQFLDYLIAGNDKSASMFQILYLKITDDRLARYIPFTTAKNNRMYFVKKVLQLWKESKYNIFFTNGQPGIDINPNGYFNYKNFLQGILEFKKGSDRDIAYISAFKNRFVTITRTETSITRLGYVTENYNVEPELNIDKIPIGDFHLFQPLFILGFDSDLEVSCLNEAIQPAFLFFYCQDFEQLKEFDAGFSLVINLGLDIGLTFLTGGIGGVKFLAYLKYFTEMGRYINGIKSATTAFKIWTNVANAAESVAITAGTISALSSYVSQVTNDPERKKFAELVATLTAFGALSTLPAAVLSNFKIMSSARAIAVELANLSAQNILLFKPGMSIAVRNALDEVVLVIAELLAKDAATITAMSTKLTTLGADANNIKNLFETSFSGSEKIYFYINFSRLTDKQKWGLLNANNAVAVQRWRILLQHKLPDFNRIEVLINANRCEGLVYLYITNQFGSKLDALTTSTRLAFVDKFYNISGTNLSKLLANKNLITYFARYYDDLAIRSAFNKLTPTKMLEFLYKYGNITDNALKLLRTETQFRIDRLLSFPDAKHNTTYFYNRRAEMLPPNFVEARNGSYVRIHEVDNAIELELYLNKKLRKSSKNEAGDLIDDLTGKSYDTMGIASDSINSWTENGIDSVNKNIAIFKVSIDRHFNKLNETPPLDFISIDYNYFEEISLAVNQDRNYIKTQIDLYITQNYSGEISKLIKTNY
ncbi:MAG: hypothetical protein MUC81_00840 [Bacteroidia bacterium]|jgi:hypothetical protein|nr:hypothetical protein [Bacteroidia bacterium]